MEKHFLLLALSGLLVLVQLTIGQQVTWYEHYTAGGRQSGLVPADVNGFTLNGKPFRLVSGSIHYFRVHPVYWRDRLKKLRAVGANTVETYLPWNLHEPRQGEFDFGDGQNDMSAFLNLRAFVQMAREEDLFVILRPGPFICAEWEFGGLPSWLLADPDMKVRTSYVPYLNRADAYFEQVFQRVADLQFTKGDGPIIAFQVENEYGVFGEGDEPRDTEYLIHLRDKMIQEGVVELFFTSDTPSNYGELGTIPGVLQTANFRRGVDEEFDLLEQFQPGKPNMVAEFWTGFFDHWGQGIRDQGSTVEEMATVLERILTRNGSVNFYMFIGGTSFSFMNGANTIPVFPFYAPDVSSYDYDAPLTEAGDYSDKYYAIKDLVARFNIVPNIVIPNQPVESIKAAYPTIFATQHLTLENLLSQVPANLVVQSDKLLSMEELPIHGGNGQSYGFILYRKKIQLNNGGHQIEIVGHVRDLAVFMVDGERLTSAWFNDAQLPSFGYWASPDRSFDFAVNSGNKEYTLDLMVENMGRNNYGPPSSFVQKKGLWEGPVVFDGQEISGYSIYPLEFTSAWVQSLTNWVNTPKPDASVTTPTMTRFILTISTEPRDTFIQFDQWGRGNRGVVFVNGFNIGRFSEIGPPRTLYVPAPILNLGRNTVDVFALFEPVTEISFTDIPDLGPVIRPDPY